MAGRVTRICFVIEARPSDQPPPLSLCHVHFAAPDHKGITVPRAPQLCPRSGGTCACTAWTPS